MTSDRFKGIVDAQIKRVQDILIVKREEYATQADVLQNFKRTAQLRNCELPQAVGGMMAKHTISIYDMIESGKPFDMAVWDEKITDHITYLILLRATLIENAQTQEELC